MARGINVGSAFVTILPSARGFTRQLRQELSGELEILGRNAGKDIEKGLARSNLKKVFENTLKGVQFAGAVAALSSVGGAAVSLAGALLPLGGFLTAAPALALSAGAAFGSLKLAIGGVSDALSAGVAGDAEKYQEALAQLTPAAQAVTRSVVGVMDGLHETAQQSFFAPFEKSAGDMAKAVSGPLKQGIGEVSTSLGQATNEATEFGRSEQFVTTLNNAFGSTADFIDGASKGIKPLLAGITDLANVFFPTVGGMGDTVGNLMTQFGTWLTQISKSGQAFDWLEGAKSSFSDLWTIAKNLVGALLDIFNASDSGGDMLGTIRDLTTEFKNWTASAEGQDQLSSTFSLLTGVFKDLAGVLPVLGGGLGLIADIFTSLPGPVQGVVTQFLAWAGVAKLLSGPLTGIISSTSTIIGMVGKIGPAIGNAVAWLQLYGGAALSAGKSAALGVGRAIASMATLVARTTVTAARVVASWISMGVAAVAQGARVAAQWALMAARAVAGAAVQIAQAGLVVANWIRMGVVSMINAIRMAAAWVIGLGPIAWIIAAVIALVALIVVFWDEIVDALETAWNFIADLAQDVWGGIVDFFVGVWEWIKDVFTTAVSTIWNLIVSYFNLIWGTAIAVFTAVVNFFVGVWNSIVAGVTAAWNWIVNLITSYINLVWTIITTVLTFIVNLWNSTWAAVQLAAQTVWELIVSWIQGAVDTIQGILDWFAGLGAMAWEWFIGIYNSAVEAGGELIDWATGLPGEILGALGDLGSKLLSAGEDLINGLWNGMKNVAGNITDWILGLLSGIKDQVLDFFGIASPSKLMTYYGEMVGAGLVRGIRSMTGDAQRAADALATAATPNVQAQFRVKTDVEGATTRAVLGPEDADLLLDALAQAPITTSVQVDSREIAVATDKGQRQLNRRLPVTSGRSR